MNTLIHAQLSAIHFAPIDRPRAGVNPALYPQNPAMTIQLRLTLWYSALLGVTLILFSVLVYSALAASLKFQIRQDAQTQANNVSLYLKEQLETPDEPRRYSSLLIPDERNFPVILQLVELPKPVLLAGPGYIRFFDIKEGKVYPHPANITPDSIAISTSALESVRRGEVSYDKIKHPNGTPLLIYSIPLTVDNQIKAGIQIIQSTAHIDLALAQVGRYTMMGTAFSLFLAAIVGAFLARRALAPIKTITQTASTITRTNDLGQRLNIPEDASEVGQLAATFNEMIDQIQKVFNAQERLIGDVSHELRTPLTTIQGNIELLQRMTTATSNPHATHTNALPELLPEILQEVESETDRMGRMISDLLLLAQVDSGELQLNMDSVEVDTLLLEMFRHAQRVAQRSKGPDALEIRLGSEDQALVRGDRERLRQLLFNLASNAVRYTPAGGQITMGLINEDGWVKVYIKDTGIGISPENQSLVFQRFYRTDKARSREFGGSGLGLSIAEGIAHAHNGHIEVESELGEGSTFVLCLPEAKL